MRILLHSILLTSLAAAVPAQMSASAQLTTGTVSSGTVAAAVPGGASVTSGFVRTCSSTCGNANVAGGQSATLEHVDIGWTSSCQAVNPGTSTAEAYVRYDFWTPIAFVGRFVVVWNAQATGSGITQLEVDLGNDGTIEATGGAVLPVTFGPGTVSLQLHLKSEASAGVHVGPFGVTYPYQGGASASVSLRLEPMHCQQQVVGAACGMAQFDATGNFLHGVKLEGPVRFGDEIAVLIMGFAPAALAISLPTTCTMLVDPQITYWQVPDLGEVPAWALTLPPSMLPVTFRAQHFGLDLDTGSVGGSAPLLITWQ